MIGDRNRSTRCQSRHLLAGKLRDLGGSKAVNIFRLNFLQFIRRDLSYRAKGYRRNLRLVQLCNDRIDLAQDVMGI